MTLIPMAAAAINNRALKSGTKYNWCQKWSHFFNLKNCYNYLQFQILILAKFKIQSLLNTDKMLVFEIFCYTKY